MPRNYKVLDPEKHDKTWLYHNYARSKNGQAQEGSMTVGMMAMALGAQFDEVDGVNETAVLRHGYIR